MSSLKNPNSTNFFDSVISNLIDITQLINHGWIPVIDTSNAKLTERVFSTGDLLTRNLSNLTNVALRTPTHHPEPTILPINIDPFGRNSLILFNS